MVTGLEAVRYAAPSARVRGLYAGLFDDATWASLVHADSLRMVLALLRSTRYGEVLGAAEPSGEASLERAERQLLALAAEDCFRAMRLTGGAVRRLIYVWWQHYELENLKAVFRGVDAGLAPQQIQALLVPLGEHASLPWEALILETSMPGLVDRLQGTHYINPLRNAYSAYERQRSLFPFETALDIRYYRDLAAAVRDLGGADGADAHRLFGTYLDMLNILWAYRHREYYHLSPEEIVNYTLWRTDHTDIRLVREIALGAEPRDVIERVFGPGRVDLPAADTGADTAARLPAVETALHRYWRGLAERQTGGYPFRLGAIIGYLVLDEIEVRDLILLLEAKGMGWSAELVQQHLTRRAE